MIDFIKKLFGKNKVDYKALVENGAQIIDVRTPTEFGNGNIKNSKRKAKTRVVFSCRTNKFVSFFQTGYFYVLFSEYRTIRNLI